MRGKKNFQDADIIKLSQMLLRRDKALTAELRVVRMYALMNNEETKNLETLIEELQTLIVEVADLQDDVVITPETPLFTEDGLALDSIDAMEISTMLRRRYHVTLDKETEDVDSHFATVATLAAFIMKNQNK